MMLRNELKAATPIVQLHSEFKDRTHRGHGELAPDLLVHMAEHFHGYGKWEAPFWSIGREAGMSKNDIRFTGKLLLGICPRRFSNVASSTERRWGQASH
jgi:hypothetical protein